MEGTNYLIKKRKQMNKMILDVDYNPLCVTTSTRNRWKKKLKKFQTNVRNNGKYHN